MVNREGFSAPVGSGSVPRSMGFEYPAILQSIPPGVTMGNPINAAMFHRSPKADRDCVIEFLESLGVDIQDVSVVEVVSGGVRLTRFIRDDDGKYVVNHSRSEAETEEYFVSCVLTYKAARCLHDMSNRVIT